MLATATPIETVRALAPFIGDHVEQIESERRLPGPIVQALTEAGIFRLFVPRVLGGGEADPVTVCRVVEELATADGSTGWVSTLCTSYGLLSGLLPAEAAHEIYADADAIVAGSLPPVGIARAVAGGYRVSGRWTMASGIDYSTWVLARCRVFDGDDPRLTPSGDPELAVFFFPRSEVEIIDTWHVTGLRGTGSNDYQVQDLFVPAHRACRFLDEPAQPGPLYALPYVPITTAMMACVALGIARHALDALEALAAVKTPTRSQAPLREILQAQAQIGEAEGLLRAGRAFVYQTVEEAWDAVGRGHRLSWEQHGLLRLAGAQAVTQALQAVDLAFRVGGSSSIYLASPLERCLRDIRTTAQHNVLQPANYESAGQLFLGFGPAGHAWGRDYRGDA